MQKKPSGLNTSAMLNFEFSEQEGALNQEQLKELESLYGEINQFQEGIVLAGKIVNASSDGVLIDIQYKSNGLIPSHEFSPIELKRLTPGNDLEVVIDRLEDESGNVVLSYQKAKALRAWNKITETSEKDEPVSGIVTHKVKGGLSVDIGIPAFLPGSQVDVQRVSDFDQFVGQEVTCKILKVNKKRGNVIISRRKYIEEQKYEDRKKALDTIQEGQVVSGIVKNITNYGVFVDIGGIDGLLHITDMSWGRVNHPSELVKIGDTISVKVLSFDKDREKISLGMKQLTDNPWLNIENKYSIGSTVTGKISSITDYGLFAEIEKGIEGLVHISEISWTDRIANLSKHYKIGDEIKAKIVALDVENRRMSLSIKQLAEDPWKKVAETIKPGEKIKGQISNITDFGLFVRVANGIDGLVHVSDLSWTDHIAHPNELFKKGDAVEAVVLSIDPDNRKISLGIKQLKDDPWKDIEQRYPVGTVVEGTITKITNFGAFVKFQDGIEGLAHISELSNKEIGKIEDILKVGEQVSFKIIKVNQEERKLALSLKALTIPQETKEKTVAKEKVVAKEKTTSAAAPKKKTAHAEAPAKNGFNNSLQQALADHAAKIKDKN
ncbi:TPA: 30S ribosomal protein S1 [Candidatus Dependentiae bacterium]|nr:MAG: 30S ribosomal protein S1 [candidate division TM6 bacterium GW2011_GWE2_31_21]KKP53940.1 MAG: 30S ribosomal protein S1 [candidate division TM6 bacterium GW2011_GWF2_33_332]HBS47720.1 30S ribosomal protein S1 [Candidatus Dependentiae bacterium]HBZ73869.1 30S ribosomal protein S1 [Candidatus Dependentiae bacterium]